MSIAEKEKYPWNFDYIPTIDGQELIDKISDIVVLEFRWSGLAWKFRVTDSISIFIEAFLLLVAWSGSRNPADVNFWVTWAINAFDWRLLEWVMYRRDNPPQGDWSRYSIFETQEEANQAYRTACEALYIASRAELARD